MEDTSGSSVRKFTLTDWGVITSMLISVGGFVFSAGYLYSQVQMVEQRLTITERKVDVTALRIERIDANVAFLTELAKEGRAK